MATNAKGATVAVGLKLPHGLVLKVYDMVTSNELVMGGGTREVKKAQQVGETYILKGYLTRKKTRKEPTPLVIGGYAVTSGIPKDFFDRWLEQNKDSDLVRNNLIFAQTNAERAGDQADEQEELKSGLEAIDPDNPGAKVKGVTKADAKDASA